MNKLQKAKMGFLISLIVSIIVIIVFLFFLFFSVWEKPLYDFEFDDLYYSEENLEIFILPQQRALDRIFDELNGAEREIHCAFRSLNYEDLENLLIEKEKEINVRLFINQDYMGNKRIYLPFVRFEDRNGPGMMHNNYCIIDQKKVITGSLIFNENTIHNNIHDVLIIDSQELARRYNSDFWRLYNNQEWEKREVSVEFLSLNDDTLVSLHFCPIENCEDIVASKLESATKRINSASYVFTNNRYADVLNKSDATKKIVIEPLGITANSIHHQNVEGIKISHLNQNVHTKLITIDDDITITGTMNPSYFGAYYNQENFLIIKSKKINEFYNNLIDYLYIKTK